MLQVLQDAASARGDRIGVVPFSRLLDVKADFDRIGVDTTPYYRFETRDDLGFETQTVLVVASPSPVTEAVFHPGGIEKKVLIPPTYVDNESRANSTLRYLKETLAAGGFSVATGNGLPCKPMAVHAGLGVYGRNNIVYVDGMGSFASINLYFTDWRCGEAEFHPLRFATSCECCGVCAKNCPTGAITEGCDRINADRCLTNLNENPADFPDWVEPAWHNALIGCVCCQFPCPMNGPYVHNAREAVIYDQAETEAFLNNELPQEKLDKLMPSWFHRVLSRNLHALI